MSLMVWLPLTQDTHNQGVSAIELSSGGTITYTAGKIGNAATFNSGRLFNTVTLPTSPISACCWVYLNTDITSLQYMISLNATTGFADHAIGLAIENSKINYVIGGNSNIKADPVLNTWMHVAVTYDGSTIRGYLNGVQIGTQSGITQLSEKTRLTIGARYNNNDTYTGYLKGKLNDVRIYSHCLSPAEVHEISQGLVLHYKLDGGIYSQPNLLPCGNTYTHSSPLVRTSKATDGAAWVSNSAFEAIPSTTYTISVECDGTLSNAHGRGNLAITDKPWSFWLYICNTDTTKNWSGGAYDTPVNFNSSNHNFRKIGNVYVWTYTLSSTQKYISVRTNTYSDGTNNITVKFWNLKIEKGNVYTPWSNTNSTTIADSSGYGHNGTIVNTPILISDTPRYSAAINFNENTDSIKIKPIFSRGQTIPELSVACWFKTNTLNSTAPNIFSLGSNSFCRARIASATSIWWYTRVASTSAGVTKSCKTLTDNIWHHMTYTFKNGIETMYIDGASVGTNNKTGTGTTLTCNSIVENEWTLAGYNINAENFIGNESDFRIYATALSAADVKSLYEVGARADNKNNMHTYEFIEKTNNNENISATTINTINLGTHSTSTSQTVLTTYTTTKTPAPSAKTNYLYGTETTYSYSSKINCSESGIYTFTWPTLQGSTRVGYFTSSRWQRKSSSSYSSVSTRYYYQSGRIRICLECYDENDTLLKTYTLAITGSTIQTRTTNSFSSTTVSLNGGSKTIHVPLETTFGDYMLLKVRFLTASITTPTGSFTVQKAPPLNPVTPQLKRTGSFINRSIDEQNFNENAQINKFGTLYFDNFIEF